MFFLKKIFQLRDHSNPEQEKPFLEHLEDFRILVTRVVITLIIATLVCFTFRNDLMDILRAPVEEVWVNKQEGLLPKGISLEKWERALELADASAGLSTLEPTLSETFWSGINEPESRSLARVAVLYRAAKLLPKDQHQAFLETASEAHPESHETLTFVVANGPPTNLNAQGNLRLMSSFKPTETFMLSMKLALFAGIVVAFPLILYFLLQFIVPGLKDQERKALWPALAVGFGLFLSGVLFSYFFVLPKVLTFFYEWGQSIGISNDWRIGYYISFATQFVLIFGLAFELPVVVMSLVHLGILSHEIMSRTRSYAIVAILIVAAIITPTPDIATLLLLATPMYILYEICIWLAYFLSKRQARQEAAEEKEHLARLLEFQEKHPKEIPDELQPENPSKGDLTNDPEIDPQHDDHHSNHPEHDDPHQDADNDDLHHPEDLTEGDEQEDIGDPLDDLEKTDVTFDDPGNFNDESQSDPKSDDPKPGDDDQKSP